MPITREGETGPPAEAADGAAVRVMDGLRRVVRVLSASARESRRRGGVSGAQLFVMRQIAGAPGLSIGELVARTLSRQSTVSEVVARLVERGLVTRRPSPLDARQTKLRLSARGRRVMKSAAPTAQEQLAHGLSALPSEQREALADGLEVWLSAAAFAAVPATMFFEEAEVGGPSRRRRTGSARRRS